MLRTVQRDTVSLFWIVLVAVLVAFAATCVAVTAVPRRIVRRPRPTGRILVDSAWTTSQTTMRVITLVTIGLMAVSALLELDVVLGVFVAGMIVHAALTVQAAHVLERKLRTSGYSPLIPVFCAAAGMGIDDGAALSAPVLLVGFVVLIVAMRGVPVILAERSLGAGDEPRSWAQSMRIGLYADAGLPNIVAVDVTPLPTLLSRAGHFDRDQR